MPGHNAPTDAYNKNNYPGERHPGGPGHHSHGGGHPGNQHRQSGYGPSEMHPLHKGGAGGQSGGHRSQHATASSHHVPSASSSSTAPSADPPNGLEQQVSSSHLGIYAIIQTFSFSDRNHLCLLTDIDTFLLFLYWFKSDIWYLDAHF